MKNWENIEADENLILTKHFTPGRAGTINKIVLHHNAGNLTIQGCYNVWQDREASAHYQVQSDGRIGQLVAALCKYYKLGRPTWMKNVFPHNHFSATECPASIAGSQNAAYMKRAQEWYDAMMKGNKPAKPAAPSKPASKPASKPTTNLNALADAVIRGEYGNGDERRRRLGGNYDAVMKIVNRKLGVSSAPARPAKKSVDTIAQEVINGAWGNGDDRRRRLEAAGYNFNEVQNVVNRKLGAASASPSRVTLDDVARAVIRGDYGNGDERRRRIEAAGYNYNAVQARVNQLL